MKVISKFFIVLLSALFLSSATGDYKLIYSIPFIKPDQMSTDRLGRVYVLVENQLLQFDQNGRPLANYSENSFGTITSLDASNPMKVLLFYSNFAKIIILDSKLAFQSDINLRSILINQPLVVCTSDENGYWIYDREDEQLKKIDMNLQVIYSSGNLTQRIGYQIQPGMMSESNGFLYVNNPTTGILIFDRYGEYFKTLPYKNLTTFQIIGSEILFVQNNKFIRVNTKTSEENIILLPDTESIISARIEQQQLYLLTNDSLKFYSF